MTTTDIRAQNMRNAQPGYYEGRPGDGDVVFAASMLGLAGTWNTIAGMLAIGDSRVYAGEKTFIFSGLNTWGWIVLLLGVLQLLAAFSIVKGSEVGRWFGIGAASVN